MTSEMTSATELLAHWRDEAATQAYFSASRVQDRLFDLYGVVDDPTARGLVETWLSLTIQRDLFSGSEVLDLLDQLRSLLAHPVSS